MQQTTACLRFAWRTTSLRVGGLPGLRHGGGGRQASATVLSCLVWRCELTAGKVHRTAPPDTEQIGPTERTYLAVEPTEFTPPHQTRQQKSCLCLAWRCELALIAATVRELGLHR